MGRLIFCPSFKNRVKFLWIGALLIPWWLSSLHLFIFECKYLPIYLSIIKHTPIESLTFLIEIILFIVTQDWILIILSQIIIIYSCKNIILYSLVTGSIYIWQNELCKALDFLSFSLVETYFLTCNEKGTENYSDRESFFRPSYKNFIIFVIFYINYWKIYTGLYFN